MPTKKQKIIQKEKDGKWVVKSTEGGLAEMVVESEEQALTLVFSIKGISSAQVINGKSEKVIDGSKSKRVKISKSLVKAYKVLAVERNRLSREAKLALKDSKKETIDKKRKILKEKNAKNKTAKLSQASAGKKIDKVKSANNLVAQKEAKLANIDAKYNKKSEKLKLKVRTADNKIGREKKLVELAKLSEEERLEAFKTQLYEFSEAEQERLNELIHQRVVRELIIMFKRRAKNQREGLWDDGWTNFEENAPVIESAYINAWEEAGETLKMRSLTVKAASMFSLLIALMGVGVFVVIGTIY